MLRSACALLFTLRVWIALKRWLAVLFRRSRRTFLKVNQSVTSLVVSSSLQQLVRLSLALSQVSN
jgi:hypothetical protein